MEAELTVLIAKRDSLFSMLQSALDFSKTIKDKDMTTLNKFKLKIKSLDSIRDSFLEVVDKINLVQVKIDPTHLPSFKPVESFYEILNLVQTAYEELNNIVNPPQRPQTYFGGLNSSFDSNSSASNVKVKLPALNLPTYNGESASEWVIFYELYMSMIHSRTDLSNAQKCQYLLSRLSGRALACCASIPATPDNYEIIFKSLVDKYNDKRTLTNSYLDTIFNFKPLKVESGNSLSIFVDKFGAAVQALKALKLTNLEDYLFVYLANSKLCTQTVKSFEMSLAPNEIPSFSKLLDFVKEHSKILNRVQPSQGSENNNSSSNSGTKPQPQLNKSKSHAFLVSKTSCPLCQNEHPIFKCTKFLSLSPQDRFGTIKQFALCINCLSASHKVSDCKSKFTCSHCKVKHNSLLCFRNNTRPEEEKGTSNNHSSNDNSHSLGTQVSQQCSSPPVPNVSLCTAHAFSLNSDKDSRSSSDNVTVLLSTIKIMIIDKMGMSHPFRFILDSGSQSNIILKSACKKLGLLVSKGLTSAVRGIGSGSSPVSGEVNFTFRSRLDGRVQYSVSSLVVDHIVDSLPSQPVDTSKLTFLENLPLADDSFMKPGIISGILGAQIFPSLLLGDRVSGSQNEVVALNTVLGYVLMGQVPVLSTFDKNPRILCTFKELPPIDNLLKRFWEIETVESSSKLLSEDEERCEELFKSSVRRSQDGSYTVSLPFKYSPTELGDSYHLARNRFLSLERKLERNDEFRSGYDQVISENLNEGYLKLSTDQSDRSGFYIPHHLVVRPDKASTKLRCVFDASMASSSSKSLNDLLYTGPKLYTDLFEILLNFRLFPIVMVADIRKMFLQIKMNPDDWKFQKVLWRFRPDQPLLTYVLSTVIFGNKSSPYLALRTVRQLASDESSNFPTAAKKVETDLYMDDLATSVLNEEEAFVLYNQMVALFKAGGFSLTKWASNSSNLLQMIPAEDRLSDIIQWDADSALKVLGLQWNADTDMFHFEINIEKKNCTKRTMLSVISRLFDPLGLLAPVILWAKQLIQALWSLNLSWDDSPPPDIVEQWNNFLDELHLLSCLVFPRHIFVVENCRFQIYGFGDASTKGYGGVVYSRVIYPSGEIKINLVCAKSKVSPVKSQSVPRLELCASLLLSQLIQTVVDNYKSRYKIDKVLCFSDSTVVLSWIHQTNPKVLETFVANRVSKIQNNIDISSWWKISGLENPADCLSRGLKPSEFCNHPLWFLGPKWLSEPEENWPVIPFSPNQHAEPLLEEKSISLVQIKIVENPFENMFQNCSSWNKLLKVMVFVLRFMNRLPNSKGFTSSDLDLAEHHILKILQKKHFSEEIRKLKLGETCNNSLVKLYPFLDNDLVRVGGRLRNSKLGFDQQHPVVLPAKDHVVNLIIDHYHEVNLHTGPNLLLSILRRKFWILGARNLVRRRIQNCNHCFRLSPKSQNPPMADLPKERVLESKAFLHSATDYMGPFQISLSRRRGQRTQKAYICLFICLATKAIHLEVASDLSTPIFLDAFKRFLARRGPCQSILSDNGSNYVGAKNALHELFKFLNSDSYKNSFGDELANQRIHWRFTPPTGSHFNGISEANVKAVKTHLYKCIGNQILSFEEMCTVTAQIECLLNSRPLCVLSSDPSEPKILTPAHFLNQVPLSYLPASDVTNERTNRLTRFKLLDQIVQTFWKRWSSECLHQLQLREKWNTPTSPIIPGQIVLIKQDNLPPLHWSLGRVIKTYPGGDSISRVALVKTSRGEFLRPANKLCPLPNQ